MKVSVDIGDTWIDDLDKTVAQVIRDEVLNAIRYEVKKTMSGYKEDIRKEAAKIINAAIKEVKKDRIEAVAKEMLRNLGGN